MHKFTFQKAICLYCDEQYFYTTRIADSVRAFIREHKEARPNEPVDYPALMAYQESVRAEHAVLCLYWSYEDSEIAICHRHAQELVQQWPQE